MNHSQYVIEFSRKTPDHLQECFTFYGGASFAAARQ